MIEKCEIKKTLKPRLQSHQKKLEVKTNTNSVLEVLIINGKFEELDERLNVLLGNKIGLGIAR